LRNAKTNLNRHKGSKINRRRPRKRGRDEFEEELSINGIRRGRQWSDIVGNEEILYWKPRSTTEYSA